jgi:hypothetical protein
MQLLKFGLTMIKLLSFFNSLANSVCFHKAVRQRWHPTAGTEHSHSWGTMLWRAETLYTPVCLPTGKYHVASPVAVLSPLAAAVPLAMCNPKSTKQLCLQLRSAAQWTNSHSTWFFQSLCYLPHMEFYLRAGIDQWNTFPYLCLVSSKVWQSLSQYSSLAD